MVYSLSDTEISDRCCRFLERICNIRSLSARSKRQIVDLFLSVRSLTELQALCEHVSVTCITKYGYNDYFTV